MAKQRKTRKRRCVKHNRNRKFSDTPRAVNYYKEQAKTINKLKPVMAAAKRFKERRGENTSKEVE